MSLKLLLTDASNALGRALEHELERESFNLVVPKPGDVDWDKAESVIGYVEALRPDLIINCTGWEDNISPPQQQLLINAATHIAAACAPDNIPLIHFSSYKVFGEDNKSTHNEKDKPTPNSAAGLAFLAAEQAIEQTLDKWICLRLSWVIGSDGDNHLSRLLRRLLVQEAVSVSSRLRGAPTLLSDAARVAVAMAKQITCGAENWGVMHYCSGDACSEAEFADQVLQVLYQHQGLGKPGLHMVDQLPDKEPVSAVLNSQRVKDYFGIQARPWRPNLVVLVKHWLHNNAEQVE